MKTNGFINTVEFLIGSAKIGEAIKKIRTLLNLANALDLQTEIILLSARFQAHELEKQMGIVDDKDAKVEFNKITLALIQIKNKIRENSQLFEPYHKLEDELDEAMADRQIELLTEEEKGIIFSRMSFIKTKKASFKTLWIDDRPNSNRREKNILSTINIEITNALSSEEALQRIQEQPFDLILSDIDRAKNKSEGIDFLLELVKDFNIQKLPPTIFYVGYLDKSKGTPPYAFGITNNPNELVHLVFDVIERLYA